MSILNVPVEQIPAYKYSVDIEGVLYSLEFLWNDRDSRMYMNVRNDQEVDIVTGIPVVVGVDLLGRFRMNDVPPGTFYAWDTSGREEEVAALEEFGKRVLLQYSESE